MKIVLVVAAVVIAVASLVVSHFLVSDLSKEERNKMETWAQALHTLNNANENTDLSLVLSVLQGNNTIPVVVVDSTGMVMDYRNVEISADNRKDSLSLLAKEANRMYRSGRFVKIILTDDPHADYQLVCYDESNLLKRLATYPYVQLGIVFIFVVVAIFALLSSKKAEQNKVWVGLSKETAHQLGTPISSLIAWIEILHENYPGDDMIPEMEKDVKRLELIADRFSKIGSLPEPQPSSLNNVISNVVDYIDRRTSSAVLMTVNMPNHDVVVRINASLFEWVIENLCKNAVDAMEGKGKIWISVIEDGYDVAIEVADNGKGIRHTDLESVFKAGFTTNQLGW